MPPLPKKYQREREERSRVTAARIDFIAGFMESRKGNYWRTYEGLTCTVFRGPDGRYKWCIAGPGGTKRFGGETFENPNHCGKALAAELKVGEKPEEE